MRQREDRAEVLVDVFLEAGWDVPHGIWAIDADVWFTARFLGPHRAREMSARIEIKRNGTISITGMSLIPKNEKETEAAAKEVLRAAGLGEWLR